MTMSTHMRRAQEKAEELDRDLRSDDPRLQRSTLVLFDDGSIFYTDSSFLVKWRDPEVGAQDWGAAENPGVWLFVLAEHHPVRVFALDDLLSWREFESHYHGPIEWADAVSPPASECPHGESQEKCILCQK